VAWGVNQINLITLPIESCRGRSNRDASLSFLLHVVHHSIPVVHLTWPLQEASIIQHSLGCGGLSSINMGYDSDVSYLGNVIQRVCDCSGVPAASCSRDLLESTTTSRPKLSQPKSWIEYLEIVP